MGIIMSKKYKKVIMHVTVFDNNTDRQVNEFRRVIDSQERRKWISDITMWALINNRYLIIKNKAEVEAYA
jgi:hypothetical protein